MYYMCTNIITILNIYLFQAFPCISTGVYGKSYHFFSTLINFLIFIIIYLFRLSTGGSFHCCIKDYKELFSTRS